jgi:LuxR family maltose regulon positive regulatory protein
VRVAASAARIVLLQGRIAETRQWAKAAQIDVHELQEVRLEHLTLARLLQAEGCVDEARELLERLAEQAEGNDQLGAAIEALVLLVVVHYTAGNATQALVVLERALQRAESEGYIRTFLDSGPVLPLLLEEGLRRSSWGRQQGDAHGAVRTYARKLLERCPPSSAADAGSTNTSAVLPPGMEPLTSRELEVLRLIALGKANGEIARELVVAVSTVKAHINNIFGKLGVTSRTQALVRARELQLL